MGKEGVEGGWIAASLMGKVVTVARIVALSPGADRVPYLLLNTRGVSGGDAK